MNCGAPEARLCARKALSRLVAHMPRSVETGP